MRQVRNQTDLVKCLFIFLIFECCKFFLECIEESLTDVSFHNADEEQHIQ
jgi:hypothetical protein